jgi:ADP-heptose:LPS heptosyltransferase
VALSQPPLIVVLRALGLGDLLTGVPALRALRRAFPDDEIVLAAPIGLEPLVRLSDTVDRIVDTRGLSELAWQGPPPKLAVNLHGKGPRSHQLLEQYGPGRLIAFGCPAVGHLGPEWDATEHETRRWCRLLEESLELETDSTDLHLRAPAVGAPVPGAVVIHPGAAYPARRWPADRFAAVARALARGGSDVVITGSTDELALAEAVRTQAGLPPRAILAGRTDLEQVAAQVRSAPLVVCGDTGIAHLSSAFGTASVVLFGPTPPATWGPPPGGPHIAIWHGDTIGDPWRGEVDQALMRVTPEEVIGAAERLLHAQVGGGTARQTT